MDKKNDIGLIGLAVMGENLAINMESKGFSVSVFNRTLEKVDAFAKGRARDKRITPTKSVQEFVNSLALPRKIMLMVKAGQPVDDTIELLVPHLQEGDLIIDGGNSLFSDTDRRVNYLESKGLLYIGTGVSGGEEGALNGPSLMPGGSASGWPLIKPIFQAIAAKAPDGSPCTDWLGAGGAGHFVKMVHNGIEYADMQLISESYHLMRDYLKMSAEEMHLTFKSWNETELDSYLIEITRDILIKKDKDGSPLLEKILDTAGQKGTGKWTVNAALDSGIPLTLIGEAVFARFLSSMKDERVIASQHYPRLEKTYHGDRTIFLEEMRQALYASKIMAYTQGFSLLSLASNVHDWGLNLGNVAAIWRGGCIIRSVFLDKIQTAYKVEPALSNLLLDPFFKKSINSLLPALRNVLREAISAEIPMPATAAGLAYFDGYTRDRLPSNLLQAQRDYFGAHSYERIDAPRGEFFHTDWTGFGGSTAAGTYSA